MVRFLRREHNKYHSNFDRKKINLIYNLIKLITCMNKYVYVNNIDYFTIVTFLQNHATF